MNSLHASRAAHAPRAFRALLLLLSLVFNAAAQQVKEDSRAAAQTSQPPSAITLDVTVMDDQARYAVSLNRDDFVLSDGKSPREITGFSAPGDPASVGVLFDISRSMTPDVRHDKIEDARRAFVRFVGRASRQNEYFLWAFNKRVIELTDWTQDAAALGKGLGEIAPGARPTKGAGSTAIYDACAAALQKLAGAHQRKRVLLVLTDGGPDDGASHELLKTLKRKVRESGALVYFVAMMDREWPGSLDAQGQEELNEIAKVSGGRAYFPLVWDELNNIIDRIAIELNSQYAISFTPTNAAKKGELNRLTIKVKPQPDFNGKLYVRAREGYISAPE